MDLSNDEAVMADVQMPGDASAWLAAVVDNAFDAILSKTLDGMITSWNAAAERLFGYPPDEAIGQSIAIIVPPDRADEEADILARLRRGDRIDRLHTVRRHRTGRLIDVELSVSPVRDRSGHIVGASKLAREITEKRRMQDQQNLLVREMHHRIGNLLSIVQGIVVVSSRHAGSVDEFAAELSRRIVALAAAHRLIFNQSEPRMATTTLGNVLDALLAPYVKAGSVNHGGYAVPIGRDALTTLALLFHELATNAVKYGALSTSDGTLDIAVEAQGDQVQVIWREEGGQPPQMSREGFGSSLLRISAKSLDAVVERQWNGQSLEIRIVMPRVRLAA